LIAAVLAAAVPGRVDWRAAAQGNDGNSLGGRSGERGRPAEPRAADPKPAAESPTNFGTLSNDAKYAKAASDTIKTNDKNGDGILEGDELPKVGMSKNGDMNGDGKIVQPELVAYYGSLEPSTTAPGASPTAQGSKPATSTVTQSVDAKSADVRKIVNTKRKSYRFKTTKERLKTSQFASRDANGDGQVSMSEYARVWSDRTAADFQRYDRDNDGMITAKEAR
jgi:Ca2+-binding EF-hand superfamily protein